MSDFLAMGFFGDLQTHSNFKLRNYLAARTKTRSTTSSPEAIRHYHIITFDEKRCPFGFLRGRMVSKKMARCTLPCVPISRCGVQAGDGHGDGFTALVPKGCTPEASRGVAPNLRSRSAVSFNSTVGLTPSVSPAPFVRTASAMLNGVCP